MAHNDYKNLMNQIKEEIGDIVKISNEKKYVDTVNHDHSIRYHKHIHENIINENPENRINFCYCSCETIGNIIKRVYLNYIAEIIKDSLEFTFDMHDSKINYENMLYVFREFKKIEYNPSTASKKEKDYVMEIRKKYSSEDYTYIDFYKFVNILDDINGYNNFEGIVKEIKMLVDKTSVNCFPELKKIFNQYYETSV